MKLRLLTAGFACLVASCTTVHHPNGAKALDLAGSAKLVEFRTGDVQLRLEQYESPLIRIINTLTVGMFTSFFGL